jgi:hypothetical protein
MKSILKTITFVLLTLFFVQSIADFFSFGGDSRTYYLFILLLVLLFTFKKPILELLSLPSHGLFFILISTGLTYIIINIFSVFFDTFSLKLVDFKNLIIMGFVIPSFSLNKIWSGVVASLLISAIYNYFDWLSRKK